MTKTAESTTNGNQEHKRLKTLMGKPLELMQEKLLIEWKKEESHPFSGWDFSQIKENYQEGRPSWSYRDKVLSFLKPQHTILDMGTGGGEFLLSLGHPYKQMSATEGFVPNYELCLERLKPLGVTVELIKEDGVIPYKDECFDLVINRHEHYSVEEVRRVLKPGGFFITQQVGAQNFRERVRSFTPDLQTVAPNFNLENENIRFEKLGFRIMYQNQCYFEDRFSSVGAFCYYAKNVPWQFPDFSVERHKAKLFQMQKELEEQGELSIEAHRFIIIVKRLTFY